MNVEPPPNPKEMTKLLVLLISEKKMGHTPTLLPRKVLNKPPFSFNKSLKTLIFLFLFWVFFPPFKQSFFLLLFDVILSAAVRKHGSAGIEMESLNGVNGKASVRAWVSHSCNKKGRQNLCSVFIYNLHKHLQAHGDHNLAMCATTKKSINRAWHGIKHPSKRSIKRPKMSDVCLSSGYCRKGNFDWAFEPSTVFASNLSPSTTTMLLIGSNIDLTWSRVLRMLKWTLKRASGVGGDAEDVPLMSINPTVSLLTSSFIYAMIMKFASAKKRV